MKVLRRTPPPKVTAPPAPAASRVDAAQAGSFGAPLGFRAAARGPRQTALAAKVLLWTMVASGPVLGAASFAAHSAPVKPTPVGTASVDTTGPAGIAELYLQAWISAGQGTESAVRTYYPAYPDQAQPAGQREAESVAVLSSKATAPGVVTVLLAAHVVSAQSGGGWADQGWHYYQVPIAAASGSATGYLALALPAEVQAPAALASEPDSAYADTDAPTSGTPLSAAVAQFLEAYLTGQGAVSRYTTAGSTLSAISPTPYASLQLTGLATDGTSTQDAATTVPVPGTTRHVLATVTAVDELGHNYTLAYPLTLQTVAGQWEVAALATSPALGQAPSSALASPAPADSSQTSGTASAPASSSTGAAQPTG